MTSEATFGQVRVSYLCMRPATLRTPVRLQPDTCKPAPMSNSVVGSKSLVALGFSRRIRLARRLRYEGFGKEQSR